MMDNQKAVDPDLIAYQKVKPLADLAAQSVRKRIEEALGRLGDPYLVRGQITAARIKSVPSLKRKAGQHKWTFEEAMRVAQDVIGFRVVCNNLQDVTRVSDLLTEKLKADGFTVKLHDYVAKPKQDGYRAIHLTFDIPLKIGNDEAELGCEIQIRSLLQDSWAQLSRDDVYGSLTGLQPAVVRDMASLARLLTRADEVAERIRRRISKPRKGQPSAPGQSLTAPALAFIYRRCFGDNPPDYLVESVIRDFGGYQLRTDGLETALQDGDFIQRLRSAYAEVTEWEAGPTQIFRWALLSSLAGNDAAIRKARSDGRAARREVAVIAQREILSGVGIKEMLRSLEHPQKDEDPEWDLESWAAAFGAISSCACCGTRIVDVSGFAEAAVRYYRVRGPRAEEIRERLEEAVGSLAVESGSWDNPSLCSYCSYQFNKDD